jgi:transcriptional regulator with XRE-family HTH domain
LSFVLFAMLYTEFVACLKRLRLKQSQFARILGVDSKTVWRWTNGERAVPKYAQNMLFLLIDLPSHEVLRYAHHRFAVPRFTSEEILGIPLGSSREDAQKAWRRLCFFAHPDQGGCAEAMKRVNSAYSSFKAK